MTGQCKSGWRRHGRTEAGQGRAAQRRQSRVGKGEGNAKDNAGHSAPQEKAKGITDWAQGGDQGEKTTSGEEGRALCRARQGVGQSIVNEAVHTDPSRFQMWPKPHILTIFKVLQYVIFQQ